MSEIKHIRKQLTKLSREFERLGEKAVLDRQRVERKAKRLLDREQELQKLKRVV